MTNYFVRYIHLPNLAKTIYVYAIERLDEIIIFSKSQTTTDFLLERFQYVEWFRLTRKGSEMSPSDSYGFRLRCRKLDDMYFLRALRGKN